MANNIKDFAAGIVLTAPSPNTSGTSLTLQSGQGDYMPDVPFYATACPPGQLTNLGNSEKILVTALSGDTITFERAQGDTTAKSIDAGWVIANAMYADDVMKSNLVTDELLDGNVDGFNVGFTTAIPFTAIQVYKNGVAMHLGDDFTISGDKSILFVTAPKSGSKITATYIAGSSVMINGSSSQVFDETPSGTVDGTNKVFTTAKPYVPGSLQVFINGVKQKRVTHFTETSPTDGTFTMSDAPLSSTTPDDVMVNYQFIVSVGGNADTVDGYHANDTPTANNVPVLNSNAQTGEWWEEIGRTTLTSNNATLSVSFPAYKYLQVHVLISGTQTSTSSILLQFNNDTANNYGYTATSAGTYGTAAPTGYIGLTSSSSGWLSVYQMVLDIEVVSGRATNLTGTVTGSALTPGIPYQRTITGMWTGTSITSIKVFDNGGAILNSGSEIIVKGHN